MEISSPRFKALVVTAGFSFWFYVITSISGIFSFEAFLIFILSVVLITQIFSIKLSHGLDVFATINTKIFLGILFVSVISVYGILFRLLKIDLLRLKTQRDTYWLETEHLKQSGIFKQY